MDRCRYVQIGLLDHKPFHSKSELFLFVPKFGRGGKEGGDVQIKSVSNKKGES